MCRRQMGGTLILPPVSIFPKFMPNSAVGVARTVLQMIN